MTGKPIRAELEEEYRRLRAFNLVAWKFWVSKWPQLEATWCKPPLPEDLADCSKGTPSEIVSGLREAASDMVEMARGLSGSDRAELERLLSNGSAPSLASIESNDWRAVLTALRRGHIRNTEEYRLVKERTDSLDDGLLSKLQRARAEQMFEAYEER